MHPYSVPGKLESGKTGFGIADALGCFFPFYGVISTTKVKQTVAGVDRDAISNRDGGFDVIEMQGTNEPNVSTLYNLDTLHSLASIAVHSRGS